MTQPPQTPLEINPSTRIGAILAAYGDIAEVMESFGVKRVSKFSMRRLIGTVLTVEWAAKIHRVPLDEFMGILRDAIASHEAKKSRGETAS